MFQLVSSAADFADLIFNVTGTFPEEEKYITVPIIRDHALNILENTALGMARLDVSYRYICLSRAMMFLNEIHKHFIICKTIALVDKDTFDDMVTAEHILRSRLTEAIKIVDQAESCSDDNF